MLSDLRHAIRSFARTPAFTAVALLTLALGIGANTAIFSVVNGVLLRPAPLKDVDHLALVWETDRNTGTRREPASVPDFLDFQRTARSFDAMAAFAAAEMNLTPASGDPIHLPVLQVSPELLPLLGVPPIAGRLFTAEEGRVGAPRVAVISESLWRRAFNRDPHAVGSRLRLDDGAYEVVGVAADRADFGVLQVLSAAAYSRSFADRGERAQVALWTPLQPDPHTLPRSTHPIFVVGHLAPGVTVDAAQREMTDLAAALERAYAVNAARGVNIEPISSVVFGPVRAPLYVLFGAVALVALVACANVAGLLLARVTTRRRELAVRGALGASQWRLVRMFLAETLLLSFAAATLGCALAWLGVRVLVGLAPADVPRLTDVGIDAAVLAAAVLLSIVIALAVAIVPIVQARQLDLQGSLKADVTRGSEGGGRRRTREAIIVCELALAVVLTIGAGLLIKSFWNLLHVEAGFHAGGVLKAEYNLPASRYPVDFRVWPDFKEQHAFTRALLERVAALPGVRSAAIAGNHPLDPGFTNSFTIAGREAEARTWPEITVRLVTPGYFQTMGLGLVRGRLLENRDATSSAPVGVINEAAAVRFFPDREPLGARVRFWGTSRTVVGVVANEKVQGLTKPAPIAVYTPLAQTPSAVGAGVLLVRTDGDPESLAAPVRSAIRALDAELAVFAVESLDRTVSRSIAQQRFTMLVLTLFAAIALTLAIVGVHAMFSYGVLQRHREIGIRLALGAAPAAVWRLVVSQGLRLAAAGVALGIAGALVASRLASTLLFGVSARDPLTFAAVALLLTLTAAAATLFPARRAARVDPVVVLRSE